MFIANEKEMLALAARFAKRCTSPLVVYLVGQLGAGKTTFSRGFLQGMGYKDKVRSPTYTLVEAYIFEQCQVYHFDFYRIHDAEELELIGIREYFNPSAICLIEWPEQGEGKIPKPDIIANLFIEATGRRLEFNVCTNKGEQIINNLQF